jgi:16S rRNA (guanine966-N2)-methyltransferase
MVAAGIRGGSRARTRITAGAWRGRLIDTPPGHEVRPTTSLVRQAVFNILGERIVDATLIDLFAGAGTISFEALSRGAARAVAVERDRPLATLIEATARRLGCADRVRVIPAEVVRWLEQSPRELQWAQLCYVDAPYRDDVVLRALELLGASPVPLVVCEHHRARALPPATGRLRAVRAAVYGSTQLTFYAARPAEAHDAPAGGEEAPTQ